MRNRHHRQKVQPVLEHVILAIQYTYRLAFMVLYYSEGILYRWSPIIIIVLGEGNIVPVPQTRKMRQGNEERPISNY